MKIFTFGPTASGSPDSPEWHEWRARHLGASDAPVIAAQHGLCKKAAWMPSLNTLWLQKTGQEQRPVVNSAMLRGKKLEEPARLAFEKAYGLPVSPLFGESDEHPSLSASFDGISFDQNTIVEIKVPNEMVHSLALKGEVVDYYKPQLAHQALVLWGSPTKNSWDRKKLLFVSYRPGHQDGDESKDLAVVEADMREMVVLAARLEPHLVDFGERLVAWIAGDKSRALIAPEGMSALAEQYIALDDEIAELTELKDAIRAKLIALAEESGETKLEGHGLIVGQAEVKGAVDYKALLEEAGVDADLVEKHRKPSRSQWTVKVSTKGGDAASGRKARKLSVNTAEKADQSWTF